MKIQLLYFQLVHHHSPTEMILGLLLRTAHNIYMVPSSITSVLVPIAQGH